MTRKEPEGEGWSSLLDFAEEEEQQAKEKSGLQLVLRSPLGMKRQWFSFALYL